MQTETRWWHRPNRVLLINLREGDEPRIDADELIRDAKRFGATAFCVSGGGIVAFYQTRIPGHRVSRSLGNRDLLAEIIPRAHAAGLRVLARIDASCAPKSFATTHPDWFSREADGSLREVSDHYVTCPNAGYYHGRMVDVVREILVNYDADGIWNNQGKFGAWETGTCYCGTCRTLFREEAGAEIPAREDWTDPVWRRFNEWRYRRIAAWVKHMHGEIHAIKGDAVFISAVQLMESLETIRPGGWDVDYWVGHQDVLTMECQRRNTAPWWPGIQAKYLSTLAPDTPKWMTASYFYPWWRLAASPQAENRPWIAQQFANGVSTWLHINGGYSELFDRRGLEPMREVMQRLARWEPYFDGARSGAEVALVFSRHTQDNYGLAAPQSRYFDAVRGAYCALLEAHIPFDVLSDKLIDEARLAHYRVIVLANTACLSDEAVAALERYVAGGGGLVATFDTACFDQDGNRRAEPALARVFGGRYAGRRENLKSSYAKLEGRDDPLLAGLGDTDLVAHEGAINVFVPDPDRAVPLTLIPPVQAYEGATISIPDLSGAVTTTDIPVAVHGRHGRGRVVYFPDQIDMLFYRYGFADLGRIFANAVLHALGGAPAVEIDAPDFVDTTLRVQPGRRLVHLINFPVGKPLSTGWRHPGRNLLPVDGIAVRLRCPEGTTVTGARVATSEAPLAVTRQGHWACVTVPRLEDHEIVIFELSDT